MGNKQIGWRTHHSSIVLGMDDVIIWGGDQDGLPLVHSNEKKRSVISRLDVLNLRSMEWKSVSTTGTPPAGAMDYRVTIIGKDVYIFDGGRCGGDCIHNDLYQLNINDKVWRCIPCTNRPMKKQNCGFISYFYQGSDYFLALGGVGGTQPPAESQLHSLYTPHSYGNYCTNEVHIMNVTMSPGQWISPTITGIDRPLAISDFSLHLLPHSGNQAIMFGGRTIPVDRASWQCTNDTYKVSMTNNTVHFTKLSPAGTPGPIPRIGHASTIISTSTQDHLLVMGGEDSDGSILSDCWILDPVSRRWSEVRLPESVCGRQYHSVSSVTLNTNTVWIIVTGGTGMGSSVIKGAEVAMVVELEYSGVTEYQWKVGGVWNTSQWVELTERIIRATNTHRNNSTLKQEMTHLRQLTSQLQQKEQELERNAETIRQKDATILKKEQDLKNDAQLIKQKDSTIQKIEHLRATQLQQNKATIQRKEKELERNAETIRMKDATIQRKEQLLQQNEATIQRKEQELERNSETIRHKDTTIQRKEQELERNAETIRLKDATIQRKEQQLQQNEATIQRKEQELERNAETIRQKDTTIQRKEQQLQQNEATIQRKEQELERNAETIRQKDITIQENEQQLQATIHQLEFDIREKDLQIQQKNNVRITQLQAEIEIYSSSWIIERDEITVTGEELGRGAWGEVRVGVFRGKTVAVKCLHQEIISAHYLELFSREMDVASRVRHPNLLQFIGATDKKVGQLMIITELMPTSLRRELEKYSLLRCQVISISTDVVSALNYLHSFRPKPILHRDVSSANVLLEPSAGNNWKGKLSDYGSVNLMDNINTSNPGSPVYSAPEASTPSLHSAAMDIYSFGILLLEMATGQFPSTVAHEREGSIQDIKWSSVKELVIQCTSTDPSLRPPTDTVLTLLRDLK